MDGTIEISDQMVAAALAVLRDSGCFPYEAEGAYQVLVYRMLVAACSQIQATTKAQDSSSASSETRQRNHSATAV